MKFVQLILRKIIKIVATTTRCQILWLKCTKFDFGWRPDPDPAGALFYEYALIDTENAFLNFIKTHGGNVQKRTEKLYGNAQG